MAHKHYVKAYCLALLMLGNTVYSVAKATGVPKSTVARWRIEANEIIHESLHEGGKRPTPGELGDKMGLNGPITPDELGRLFPFRR